MPNTRMLLWFALAAILYLNYEAWMHDYPASGMSGAAAPSAGTSSGSPAGTLGDTLPQAPTTAPTAAPTPAPAPASAPAAADTFAAPPASAGAAPDASSSAQLHVSTDVLDILINLKGGELDQADLKEYPQRKDTPNIPVRLLSRDPAVPAADAVCSAAAGRSRADASRAVELGREIFRARPERQGTACAVDVDATVRV